jgi:peroxiredoxin
MVTLESTDVLKRGDRAPSFALPGTDGKTHRLETFDGYEALLLVFTCNHCPYAKAKFEEMNRLTAEYDEVGVVGINPNDETEYPEDDLETMVERVEDGLIQWDAYLRDGSQEVAAAYGAMCTPDPFLFEHTGRENAVLDTDDERFRLVYHGRLDDALDPNTEPETREMKTHIDTLLSGGRVTEEFRPSRGCSIKWRQGNEPAYWNS